MPIVFVFEPDLIFASKFEGLSRLMGIDFKIFSVLDEFTQAVHAKMPRALILNLDLMDSERLTDLTHSHHVLGYYSHINSNVARDAKQMGVEYVVARGAFVLNAPSLINQLLNFKPPAL